jgi:hypothetical protein
MSIVRNVALFGLPSAGPLRVDLLDRVIAGREGLQRQRDAEQADVVGDKAGHVLRDDDAFAEAVVRERRDSGRYRGIRVRSRDEFEESQVARRIEEMRAEPVPSKIPAAVARAAIRMPDVFELAIEPGRRRHQLSAARAYFDLFDDGFNDPVGAGDLREIAIDPAMVMSAAAFSREERVRLKGRAPSALAGRVGRGRGNDGMPAFARARQCAPITPHLARPFA